MQNPLTPTDKTSLLDDCLATEANIAFKPIDSKEIIEILGLTIKKDEDNKLLTFLAELTAYTEDSQINISFNAPSSTGKSFIPTEIANLFPPEDLIEVAYCSPTAFFHNHGVMDLTTQTYTVDLSKKILIFLDQPHTQLVQHLRPLLSHDKKEINIKITDKSQKYGLKTKNIVLIGYPAVIFCTAGLNCDEQEATRFLLLSPEISQEKIRESVHEKIKKESNSSAYIEGMETNNNRNLLKERVIAIKNAKIKEIRIESPEIIEKMFIQKIGDKYKPRHQRDISRVTSLIKVFALLNLWFRKNEGNVIFANNDDIQNAFKLWGAIAESQELSLPPYVFNLYKDVILKTFEEKNSNLKLGANIGLTKQEINKKHFETYGRFLPDWQFRLQIIPMLETAGLIYQEQDTMDKRKTLFYPTSQFVENQAQKNSVIDGVVNNPAIENEKNEQTNVLSVPEENNQQKLLETVENQ